MKLKIGDKILVHGWVMLHRLEDGQTYKVHSTPNLNGNPTYQFTKPKGKKIVTRHFANHVDLWIGNSSNLNRIEVLNA